MISDPSSFLPTLVFPMDEPSQTEKLKKKLENILSNFQEQLSEPRFSNDMDETFKSQIARSEENEKGERPPNSTMLKLVDFLKDNEEVKSMATNLIKSALPNIIESLKIE